MTPNPTPRRHRLELHQVDEYRRGWCAHELACLEAVAELGAAALSCQDCSAFEYDEGARDRMVTAARLYLADGEEAISDTGSGVSETQEQEISLSGPDESETSTHDKVSRTDDDDRETESARDDGEADDAA